LAGILLLIVFAVNDHKHNRSIQKLSAHISLANRELFELKNLRDEQLLTVSHQLKTPLTVIKGYASMLDEGDYGSLSVAQVEAINAILESSGKALRLTSDILEAGAVEDPASRNMDIGAVNMRQTVSDVIDELKPKAQKKNIYMYFDQVNHTNPLVQGDSVRLRQAILNILDNAITYTREGGVTVRLLADAKGMRLSISDTGIGIHAEDQRKLFEKFYRGENAKVHNPQGNGMGMYIARKIIEAHGGTVWAESAGRGKGSTFNLWLPVDEQRFKSIKGEKKTLEKAITVAVGKTPVSKASMAKSIKKVSKKNKR
jgi:signal transduction histidine kinase